MSQAVLVQLRVHATWRCFCELARNKATVATAMVDEPSILELVTANATTFPESYAESHAKEVKPFKAIPGPRGLPLMGNALKYSKLGPYSFEKILDNRLTYMRKYGKIYREKLGTMWIVHLFDPSDLATMFRKEGQHPSRGTIANLEVMYLKRNQKLIGFAFLDGPEWTRQRGLIQKLMMYPTAATRYMHLVEPVAQDFAQYLDTQRDADGIVPHLYENLFKYTMETIGSVCFAERLGAFGTELGDPTRDAGRLSSAISETFYCFRNCMFSFPWYQYFRTPMYKRFEKAANTMREIMGTHVRHVDKLIRERHQHHMGLSIGRAAGENTCPFAREVTREERSLYEIMMRDERITDDLRENLIMALFRTGMDSTGNGMAFFLYNLAQNPEKQEKLYREIKQQVPVDTPVTADALQKMHYLKAALRESFRLHFPVFGGSGRVMPEDVVFSNFLVPKGVFIFANMAAMSRMEEYFPRPEEYHPERWLRDERADMRTTWPVDPGFLSLPFGHGMRACPGKRFGEQSLYMAIIAILQRFRLEYDGDDVQMLHMPFTTPDRPLRIKFLPRV